MTSIMTGLCTYVSSERFTDEQLTQQSGIYFENKGPLRITTSKWDLIAYFNMSDYEKQWEKLENFTNATIVMCKSIEINTFNCGDFLPQTLELINKINKKKNLIFSSIGYHNRNKRSILDTLAKTAQLLYGLCNHECIQKFNLLIHKFGNSNDKEIKLIEEQVKIIKLTQAIENINLEKLKLDMTNLENITVEQHIKNHIYHYFTYSNLLLTKHIFETNILIETIQLAKLGQIHPNIGPTQLLKQFRDIKVSLPSGTDLPIELDILSAYKLLRLSDVTVYYSNNIIFVISLPLVYQNELTLYHLIPKPICINKIHCAYIKPSYNFLAISKSKELYSTYNTFNYDDCKQAHQFLLCPEINPLHPRSTRPICEIQLLQDPTEVPKTCDIRFVTIATTIFHKLQYQNAWLYVTNGETIFITCDTDKESSSHALEGVGILRLNETCKGYATRDVLIPGRTNTENYQDFVPNSKIGEECNNPDDYTASYIFLYILLLLFSLLTLQRDTCLNV